MNTRTQRFVKLHKEGKIDDVTIIKMAAFKEMLEEELLNKEAMGPLQAAGLAALMGAASGAAALGVDAYLDSKEKKQQEEAAKYVLERLYQDPEIKKYPQEILENNFEALYKVSPHIASNPIAAKSYLLNMLAWSDSPTGVPITHFSEMAKFQESVSKAQGGGGRGNSMGSVIFSPVGSMAEKAGPSNWLATKNDKK